MSLDTFSLSVFPAPAMPELLSQQHAFYAEVAAQKVLRLEMPAVTIHLLASDMMQEVKAAGTSSDESAAEQVCFSWCRCGV